MKSNLYFMLAFALLASCSSKKEKAVSNSNAVTINLSPKSQHTSVSDAIQITRVINLESIDSSTISNYRNIKRILEGGDRLFVMDGKYMAIKVFDRTGKFLYNIGSLGIRRGQFTNLQSIALNPYHRTIWALCNTPSKVIEFSMDGKVLKDTPIPFFASDLGFETGNRIWFFINQNRSDASEDKNMLITDSTLKIKQGLFDLPTKLESSILFAGGIYSMDNKLYFNPPFGRTFYSLRNGSPEGIYRVEFEGLNAPEDFPDDSLSFYLSHRSLLTRSFIKKDGYVGFSYQSEGNHMLSFFSLKDRRLITTDAKLNPLDDLFNNSVFQTSNQLIMLSDLDGAASVFKNNEEAIKEKYPSLYKSIVSRKPHDNPALIFFTLKK